MAKLLLRRHQVSRRKVLQTAGLAVGAMAVSTSPLRPPRAVAALTRQHYDRNMVSVVSPAYCST
ncbi:MAG: twin-arginine translocation signal domain-containing protein, partial [Phycisphaerae bacterium]|nr:twin-arginine translocation signal domain-containing protein [Phycisphaerae bacterium]